MRGLTLSRRGAISRWATELSDSLDLSGVAGTFASTEDKASLDITGDLIIWGRFAADDWTPSAFCVLVGKFVAATNNRSFRFYLNTNGRPGISISANGTSASNRNATAAVAASDGEWAYVLFWLDVDNGAAGHDVKFYTSADGTTWTQLGTTVTTAGVTSLFSGAASLDVGSDDGGTANNFPGLVGQVEVRSGGSIDGSGLLSGGTVVASPNFANVPSIIGGRNPNQITDAQGNVWTINGTGWSWAAPVPTTYTIFSSAVNDGRIIAEHATYATARETGPFFGPFLTGAHIVGQVFTGTVYDIYESFLSFDTSGVVGTILTATLSFYGSLSGDQSDTDFVVEVRLHDWGASLATADWVAGSALAGKTLLASKSTVGGWSLVAYNDLTSDAAFIANINQAGTTRMVVASSRQRVGDQPTGNELIRFYNADEAGTTKDPKLVITAI